MKFRDYIFENTIKSFDKHLLNEDYMRFLKKNKNLTYQQRADINDYFYKVNPHAGKKIDWQSKDVQNWTYQDFMDIKQKYTSGMKSSKNLKCDKIRIPISNDEYIRVKMPTKEFCAFIPLTYDAAKMFNTRKLGVCSGPWCIGSTETSQHWNDIVIVDKEVPIYVINNKSKWVVMIKPGNMKYDVWSVENDYRKTHEGIPGFSIRKNLLTPALKKLYNEVRNDYFDEKEPMDISKAMDAYSELVNDMESARIAYQKAHDDFYETNENIKNRTLKKYEEHLEDIEDKISDLKNEINNLDDEDEINDLENEIDELTNEADEIESYIDYIEDISVQDMAEEGDIEWVDEPLDEDMLYSGIDFPYIPAYSDYTDLMEDHGLGGHDLEELVLMFVLGESGWNESAELFLSDNGWYDPEIINEY